MDMKVFVGGLLVLALASCGDEQPSTAASGSGASTALVSAEPLCAAAAAAWGGTVAGAFPMKVSQVRAYMQDPHATSDDPAAPRPLGAHAYPSGWDAMDGDASAAACYLDGHVPKGPPPPPNGTAQPSFDRRLVISAQGVETFMVGAGYKASMPAEPLSGGSG